MQRVIKLDSRGRQMSCERASGLGFRNAVNGHAAPTSDRLSPFCERVLRILVVENIVPDQFDLARAYMRLQLELRIGFNADSCLALIVERTIEATEIEVEAHHSTSSLNCLYAMAMPSRRGVFARQPRASMRLTSSSLRGVPSGLVWS